MKDSNDINTRSHTWIYCIVWILITLSVIYIRFKGVISFNLLVSYLLGIWIPMMIINLYEFHRLLNYVKKVYPDECEDMRSMYAGIGISSNTLMAFVDANSLDDAILKKLGKNYKKFDKFVNVVFFSFLPIALILLSK